MIKPSTLELAANKTNYLTLVSQSQTQNPLWGSEVLWAFWGTDAWLRMLSLKHWTSCEDAEHVYIMLEVCSVLSCKPEPFPALETLDTWFCSEAKARIGPWMSSCVADHRKDLWSRRPGWSRIVSDLLLFLLEDSAPMNLKMLSFCRLCWSASGHVLRVWSHYGTSVLTSAKSYPQRLEVTFQVLRHLKNQVHHWIENRMTRMQASDSIKK